MSVKGRLPQCGDKEVRLSPWGLLLSAATAVYGAGIIPSHPPQRFQRVDDLRQAFFPGAFAGEAGGEVGFGEGVMMLTLECFQGFCIGNTSQNLR
jgi:hypothetical protein